MVNIFVISCDFEEFLNSITATLLLISNSPIPLNTIIFISYDLWVISQYSTACLCLLRFWCLYVSKRWRKMLWCFKMRLYWKFWLSTQTISIFELCGNKILFAISLEANEHQNLMRVGTPFWEVFLLGCLQEEPVQSIASWLRVPSCLLLLLRPNFN